MRLYVLVTFTLSLLALLTPTCEKKPETPSEVSASSYNSYHLDAYIDFNSYLATRNGLLSLRKDQPRYLIITTPGGQVYYGKLLKEFVVENKINTICVKLCSSMGTVIFNAGSQRLITENTKLYFHEWLFGQISGSISAIRNQTNQLDEVFIKENTEIARRSKLRPPAFIAQVRKSITYSTQQALENNLADGLVTLNIDPENPPRKVSELPPPDIFEIRILPQVMEN